MSEPTIYNQGAYKSPGIYKDACGVYNGRGVYNDGAGGGANTIEIEGYTYTFVKIGALLWITENLRVNAPNAVTYKEQAEINEYGLYYKPSTDFQVIESLLPHGWRIATRNDYLNLYAESNNNNAQFIRNCFSDIYPNGENLSGLNLLSCGYRGSGGSWYNDNSNSIIWTSTKKTASNYYDLYTGFNTDGTIRIVGTFMNDATNGDDVYRCVARICADAE